ncbi:hypothetical protein SPB21_03820 [Leptothoe sp. ISB3NOV94-8A]
MIYPHAHTLLTIMEQHNWGWNLCNFINASRPFLVAESGASDTFGVIGFVGYPCSVDEGVEEILAQLNVDHDGPENHYLLCFSGVPTPENFTELWLQKLPLENVSITWCDTATRVKWQRQVAAMIDEHHPGGVRQFLLDHPCQGARGQRQRLVGE